MIWIAIHTLLGIAGVGLALGKLYNNHWRSVIERPDGIVFGYIIVILLYWGIVATLGWIPVTVFMVAWAAVNVGVNVFEHAVYGGNKTSVIGLILGVVVSLYINIGLWVAYLA